MRVAWRSSWSMKKPDRALTYFTKVTRRDPSCLPCNTMLGLAELAPVIGMAPCAASSRSAKRCWRTAAWDARNPS